MGRAVNEPLPAWVGQSLRRAVECNLVEEGEAPVDFSGRSLTFAIAPYEIKTFRLWFER